MADFERTAVVICPACGDAYLHTGAVTEAGVTFQKQHGNNCHREPSEKLDRDAISAAVTLLLNTPCEPVQ